MNIEFYFIVYINFMNTIDFEKLEALDKLEGD